MDKRVKTVTVLSMVSRVHCLSDSEFHRNTLVIGTSQEIHLFECKDAVQVKRLLEEVNHRFQSRVFPWESRVIKHVSAAGCRDIHSIPKLTFPFETVDYISLEGTLREVESVNDQIEQLYQKTRISKEGLRLRFFLTSIIEDVIRRLFPQSICRPFGSTVNGFAQKGCDLDVNMQLNPDGLKVSSGSQFYFCAKYRPANERSYIQQTLSTIGAVLESFIPCTEHVVKILNARVPIIKLSNRSLGISCDLTLDNRSSHQTAKVFWMFSVLQPSIRLLLFVVRRWAREIGLTRQHPGTWLSNFQLICLVAFFMQCRNPPLLPSIDVLLRQSSTLDKWQRSVKCSPEPCELLIEFFRFFTSQVNYENQALDLFAGQLTPKTEFAPIVIWNPMEDSHNITRNVESSEWQRCLECMEVAIKLLERSKGCKPAENADVEHGAETLSNPLKLDQLLFTGHSCSTSSLMSTADSRSKIQIVQSVGADEETCRTFLIERESHTIGVVLRHLISQYSGIRMCSYSVPHPMEDRILLHIETCSLPAVSILRRALKEASTLYGSLATKFKLSVASKRAHFAS
ncbi:RNA polymerase Rpb3/Rpb11 dimerization domain protein [Trichuris suis]|nr:RNA polymerase Rpb3/Rpb11 dimerization domain protein [Trichuris suis]